MANKKLEIKARLDASKPTIFSIKEAKPKEKFHIGVTFFFDKCEFFYSPLLNEPDLSGTIVYVKIGDGLKISLLNTRSYLRDNVLF